jgi:outer membrane protein TolC
MHHRRVALLLCAGMAGCATYQPKPLPEHAASAASLSQLQGYDAASQALDMAAVERLVLLNNPDLKSQHARRQAAQAQRAQDGVLPNPSLGGSVGYLVSGPGDATAWTASISQDITSLITLRPRREAAKANADAVDASLLWEQWQLLGKARLLVIDIVEVERQLALQQQALDALAQRESRILDAVRAGNVERVAVASDLAAAADARTALNDLQRRQLDQQQQLDALLGLQPGVAVPLSSSLPAPSVDAASIRQQFDDVNRRRPDLVALQLGYRAQEATLRAAVLAQFPPLAIGYDASQDNSRVRNGGPAVNFTLPLFDHNQHNVAIAKATREQLHQEYTVRLATSHDDVEALLAQYAQGDAQRRALIPAADDATHAAAQAGSAARDGLLDLRNVTDLRVAAINRQLAQLATEQAMLEQQAALELLVGRGMPTALEQDVMAP